MDHKEPIFQSVFNLIGKDKRIINETEYSLPTSNLLKSIGDSEQEAHDFVTGIIDICNVQYQTKANRDRKGFLAVRRHYSTRQPHKS